MKRPIERLLEGVFRIGRYHAWWVVIVWALATGIGVYYSLDSPFRGAFLDLLPVNEPLIDEYRENEKYSGDAVGILFELIGEIPESNEERDALLVQGAEDLAAILRDNEEFTEIIYTKQISEDIPDQYVQLF
ncbi:hypothetical protein KAR02_04055, partial [Candidatus Bipolaricaulota bacterium]|nr:hypothetical protein [Candidatus Bipolaricaulota bacterium]